MQNNGTLELHEIHPATKDASAWIKQIPINRILEHQEALCSCAIGGNRLAEICAETLRRWLANEPVSDRYFLGLCWTLMQLEKGNDS